MKARIRSLITHLAHQYGYQLVPDPTFQKLVRDSELVAAQPTLLFQVEPTFQSAYSKGLEVSGTKESGQFVAFKRQNRFYNLMAIHRWVSHLPGWQAECGCWKGLSSYMLNHQSKRMNSTHDGSGFVVVDSFEGLSEPTPEDREIYGRIPNPIAGKYARAGKYKSTQEAVRKTLSEFPGIEYFQGWIPEILTHLPERTYSFVHIDLDLHDPIRGAIDYFFPRLVPGGVLVLDDYGSIGWPGAMKAGDEGAAACGETLLPLSSGQAILVRRSASTIQPATPQN